MVIYVDQFQFVFEVFGYVFDYVGQDCMYGIGQCDQVGVFGVQGGNVVVDVDGNIGWFDQ